LVYNETPDGADEGKIIDFEWGLKEAGIPSPSTVFSLVKERRALIVEFVA
jgi:hypothetical protein